MTETKSLSVSNDVYLMIKKKQAELIELSGHYVQMTYITDWLIKYGIDKINIIEINKKEDKMKEEK